MILLALESAGPTCSVVVWDAGEVEAASCLAERSLASSGNADRLVELIAGALADAGLDHHDLDVVAVDHGPGSFTGIRSGVAAARALALAADLPIVAVGGLEALAGRAGECRGRTLLATLDARRQQVYVQPFTGAGEPLAAPRVVAPASALDGVAAGPVHLIGSGAPLVAAAQPAARDMTSEDATPGARDVARRAAARLACGERPSPGFALEPLYLRAPDARLPRALVAASAGAEAAV